MRNLKLGYFTPLIIFIFISIGLATLLTTQLGLRMTFRVLQKTIPGNLSYREISGTLSTKINIRNFHYQNADCILDIERLHLHLNLSYLLLKQIHFKHLRASHIRFSCPSFNNEAFLNFPIDFSLPIKIESDDFVLTDLQIGPMPDDFPVKISLTQGQLTLGYHRIHTHIAMYIQKPSILKTKIDIEGPYQQYRVNWKVDHTNFHWTAAGTGGLTWLDLETSQATIDQAPAHFKARLNWEKNFSWQAVIDVQNISTHRYLIQDTSSMTLHMRTKGEWIKDHPEFTLHANLQTPNIHLQVDGLRKLAWDLQWSLQIPNLSAVFPHSSGSINSKGKIGGSTDAPHIVGELKGEQIKISEYQATQLFAKADVDLSFQNPSFFNLDAVHMQTPAKFLQNLSIQLKTEKQLQKIQINGNAIIDNKPTSLEVSAAGALENKKWQGYLETMRLQNHNFGIWNLAQKSPLILSSEKIIFSNLCLKNNGNMLCGSGEWDKNQPWKISINSRQLPLSLLGTRFPNVQIKSPVAVKLNMAGKQKKLTEANLNVNVKEGLIRYQLPTHIEKIIPINQVKAQISLNASGLMTTVSSDVLDKGRLSGKILLPQFNSFKLDKNQMVQGNLHVDFPNLNFIKTFLPPLMQPSGSLHANFALQGTLKNPLMTGKLILQHGKIQIPLLHLTLSNISMDVIIKNNLLNYHIFGYTDEHPLEIIGSTNLSEHTINSNFIIKGQHILVLNTVEYKVFASGELHVDIKKPLIHITGNILIPEAILRPIDLTTGDSLPEEIVYVHRKSPDMTGWQTTLALHIQLGNNVHINSFGVEGLLGGELNLARKIGQDITAEGRLSLLNGTFTAHGHKLIIDPSSSIIFAHSPLNNPNLNIRVTREIMLAPSMQLSPKLSTQFYTQDTLTVGIDIQGTLRRPHTNLYATNPNLSQADILSYLILAHAANANSPGDVSLLLDAINSLKIGGGNAKPGGIIDQITQGLGLSEFGVESTQTFDILGTPIGQEESSFVVGRYFSSHFYLRYSTSLTNSLNIIQLRYLINNHWSIQTESSSQGNGADVLYSFQRD